MIVDTSAFMAILLKEPDADLFLSKILDAETSRVSAATMIELYVVAIGRAGAGGAQDVDMLLARCGSEIVPLREDQVALARTAILAFGKGRGHPAKLNFGDCFSYALAKATGEPLLYKGEDFANTDIVSALA